MSDKIIIWPAPKLAPTEQHAKIKGYRKLTDVEINLMNRAKSIEAEVISLFNDIQDHVEAQHEAVMDEIESAESNRLERAWPFQWVSSGFMQVQTGLMQMIRAVAQPECQLYLLQVAAIEAEKQAEADRNEFLNLSLCCGTGTAKCLEDYMVRGCLTTDGRALIADLDLVVDEAEIKQRENMSEEDYADARWDEVLVDSPAWHYLDSKLN